MRSAAAVVAAFFAISLLGPTGVSEPGGEGPEGAPDLGGGPSSPGHTLSAGLPGGSVERLVDIASSAPNPLGRNERAALARWAGGGLTSLGAPARAASSAPAQQSYRGGQEYGLGKPFHEFFFTRARYSGYSRGRRGGGGGSWAVDWPEADYTFTTVIDEFLDIDVYLGENTPRLDDPELRRFPFLYALEVGGMALYPEEVEGLRSYLLQGGFLVIDDFWDTEEWWNFESQMALVFPEYPIQPIPFEHPVLHTVYDVEEIRQVPNIGNARRGGDTGECWGPCEPTVSGIFDEKGRLMVIINFNTDLGDAWEWADDPYYPTYYSSYAFFMGMNMIVYALAN